MVTPTTSASSAARRTLRVAAIQLPSENGQLELNLARATPLVEQAAERGARLILLPEFLATGYVFDRSIWDAAEPEHGPTARWLAEHSRRLGVHLGASFLEAEGEDFFNTFVLARPDGREAGRVRKQTPAAFEAFFTRGEVGSHVIDTELGRIGVGICYENQLAETSRDWREQSVDLVLMPHSAPSPERRFPMSARLVDEYDDVLRGLAGYYSELMGVPVVLVNKCGTWKTSLPGLPFLSQRSSFPGASTIADSDGRVLSQLGAEPGVLVEEVVLDPARKTHAAPACRGRYLSRAPWAVNLFRLAETLGSRWYRQSAERKARALSVSRER